MFCHTVFMCFVFISEQTATCATYSIPDWFWGDYVFPFVLKGYRSEKLWRHMRTANRVPRAAAEGRVRECDVITMAALCYTDRKGNHCNECDVINMAALCYTDRNKLVWILRGDQQVGMNITGRPKSWYEYYRVIKKLVWILQGDQKVGMDITGWSKSWYEYYRVIKKFVWILQGDQKVGMNITGLSKIKQRVQSTIVLTSWRALHLYACTRRGKC
jgi:translation initiation factor IF-1